MTDDVLPALVAVVRDITGRLAASGPLPRGWPYLGLDHPSPTSLDQLAGLARHGIFRKYEQVLVLAGGLGAPARWAAAQLGCTALSTTPSAREAALAGALTTAAGLGDAVSHLAGSTVRLPLRDGAVTHVWAMESLGKLPDAGAALAEAHRVVRPGGQLALLELASAGTDPVELGGRTAHPGGHWVGRVREAGFVDVAAFHPDEASDQPSARVAAARARLRASLEAAPQAGLRELASALAEVTAARAASRVRVIGIVARRP